MPEGDTIFQAATRVRAALVGQEVVDVWGSARELRPWADRLRGLLVTDAVSRGKHLVIEFDRRFMLRTHMGMTGSWRIHQPGGLRNRAKARVVIETEASMAVCSAAPDIELGTSEHITAELAYLGPDLLAEDFSIEEAIERVSASMATAVGELLLDQTVMAGVGNVYKSEILFLERFHPECGVNDLGADEVRSLVQRARSLLLANRDSRIRATTGSRRRGHELYVYDRARRPCRRCSSVIEAAELGSPPRVTYWCPRCQPAA